MKFNEDKTTVELTWEEAEQLEWFEELLLDLDEETIEKAKNAFYPFKFFKHGAAEVYADSDYQSDGFVSIGDVGVSGEENWEDFLEQLENIEEISL